MALREDHMTPFIFLSKEKEASFELMSSIGAMVEGDKKTLLEIVDEIDHTVIGKRYYKFMTAVDFDED